jgi:chromosome segregation ATPase
MLEDMNSEEEMAYLQKMEEEALRQLEEEEARLKELKEKERAAKEKANIIIEEPDLSFESSPIGRPESNKHFLTKEGSNRKVSLPLVESGNDPMVDPQADSAANKGITEASYIAQTLQLIDKNLELKKVREEKATLEQEISNRKEEIDDMKDKILEFQESQRTFQLACKTFVEKVKRDTERALHESQDKTSSILKLARDLDELNLKLIYVANDSDLKTLGSSKFADYHSSETVSELSSID